MIILKSALYLYQRAFFYIGIAKMEALKPLGFWNETLLIVTFLAVKGIEMGITEIVLAYGIVLILATLIGKILVVIGIPRYVNRINNYQNPEIMTILERLERIEQRLR